MGRKMTPATPENPATPTATMTPQMVVNLLAARGITCSLVATPSGEVAEGGPADGPEMERLDAGQTVKRHLFTTVQTRVSEPPSSAAPTEYIPDTAYFRIRLAGRQEDIARFRPLVAQHKAALVAHLLPGHLGYVDWPVCDYDQWLQGRLEYPREAPGCPREAPECHRIDDRTKGQPHAKGGTP